MMKTQLKRYILVSLLLGVMACSHQPPVRPGDPNYAPVLPPSPPRPALEEGSLYNESHGLALFGNTNSHRIGDIITIVLDERTVSSKSSAIAIDKETDISLLEGAGNTSTVLGNGNLTTGVPLVNQQVTIPTTASQSREFAGDASADQSNRLQGNISVTITDVMPNGNLVVRGEKWMKLNRGDEYIRISGILRPQDVTLQNTVPSTKMANARITYSGTGELADSQKMGWLSRFFNSPIWPF